MPTEKYKNIVCFGEVLWDMLPTGAEPGGAPLNVAVHLIRQNVRPKLISKIGKDKLGKALLNFLNESGIETDYIQVDKKLPTSQVNVHLDKNKNATYEICEPVAWDNIQFNDKIEELSIEADLIIYGSLASRNKETLETLLQMITKSKALRFLDVNLRPPYDNKEHVERLIQLSDFVKLNDEELKKIADWNNKSGTESELMHWLSKRFESTVVCVTRGANGAALLINNQLFEHPGYIVKTADSVGAGDSFLAGLVANLSKNTAPEKALEFACATGAFVASQKGAVPNYSKIEIEKIINSTSN